MNGDLKMPKVKEPQRKLPPGRLWPDEAAEYLGITAGTLQTWRGRRCPGGPHSLPYLKVGDRVQYRLRDLDAFLDRRLVGAAPAPAVRGRG